MPVADPSFGWQEATAAFAVISVVAFLVTWVVTDLGHVSRTPYVAILTLTTLALAGGYLAWSGTSLAALVTEGWAGGLLGGVVAAALVAPLVRRLPAGPRPEGARARRVTPVGRRRVRRRGGDPSRDAAGPGPLAGRRCARLDGHRMGDGWASGTLAVIGALFVILVHHLGYREFRARAVQKDAGGCAGGLRHPGAGVPSHGKRARPDRRPHRAALAVDAPRERDAASCRKSGSGLLALVGSRLTEAPAPEKELVA